MCRIYGFRANELTKVECSLVQSQNALLAKSRGDASGRRLADGWGVACYGNVSGEFSLPELIRHTTAAFGTNHFSRRAEATYARTVLAHVRIATEGYVGTMNSHPFGFNDWRFAHYGTIPGFRQLKDELADESGVFQNGRLGATDSEQMFLWLLERLEQGGVSLREPNADLMSSILAESVAELASRSGGEDNQQPKLTFIMTNGRLMFACRFNTPLYRMIRDEISDCEICGAPHVQHDAGTDYRAVIFASEPITGEPWEELTNQSLTTVNNDSALSVSSIEIGARTAT